MLIISGTRSYKFASELANKLRWQISYPQISYFNNNELSIEIDTTLDYKQVVIVQSFNNGVNDALIELLLLVDLVLIQGCQHLILVVPYFGYSRHDKVSVHQSQPLQMISRLLNNTKINKIITADIHTAKVLDYFNNKLINLDITKLFATALYNTAATVVIAPDKGGIHRAKNLAHHLNINYTWMNKVRYNHNVIINEIHHDIIDKTCVIIDDILDTGQTLYCAVDFLRKKGINSITLCITHLLGNFKNLNIDALYTTNTIENTWTNQLSLTNLFAEEIIKHIS